MCSLRQPLGWEALKQALRNARVRIEDLAQQMGVLAAATLVPEPIPLDVKVVLIGDPETYYALYAYDEQFEKAVQGARRFRRGDGVDVGQRGAHRPLHSRAL